MRRHGSPSTTLTRFCSLPLRTRPHIRYPGCSSFHSFVSPRLRCRASDQIHICDRARSIAQNRVYHSTRFLRQSHDRSSDDDKPIAVLGGGITGMAAAYYLTKAFPERNITLFESKDYLGGWIRSTVVDAGNGEVTFESGPRSLRPVGPAGQLALRLVQEIGLIDDLLVTDKSSPAAQNRFIYYPDHLVRMPGPKSTAMEIIGASWKEPVFNKLLPAIWNDFRNESRPQDLKDESVGSFISRRGHKSIVDNMLSAVFHGIYAGDVWRLSAKSILPALWAKEARHGNLINAYWEQLVEKRSWQFCDDIVLTTQLQGYEWNSELVAKASDCSVFTFKRGITQIAERLEEILSDNPQVKILKSTEVSNIQKINGNSSDIQGVQLEYKEGSNSTATTATFSNLVSTIRPDAFVSLLEFATKDPSGAVVNTNEDSSFQLLASLSSIPAATVCVVNLYYRTPHLLQTVEPPGGLPESLDPDGLRGFGYLLPASLPFEQNPERALGVIFDSDISPDLHTTVAKDRLGTRLTVMLGGHWWDDWSSYPDDDEAQDMAMNILARHLGIVESPAAVNVSLQKDCIPQYHVGHSERLGKAHEALWDAFNGRIRAAGSWFTGVGVNDCLRSAWELVEGLKADESPTQKSHSKQKKTGLERFSGERPMALVKNLAPGEFEILDADQQAVEMGFLEAVNVRAARPKQDK